MAQVRQKPRSNVYTIMLLIAALALCTGAAMLYRANTSITGESNPLHIVQQGTP